MEHLFYQSIHAIDLLSIALTPIQLSFISGLKKLSKKLYFNNNTRISL